MTDSKTPLIRSNQLYDILKYVVQIVLPATATLYFALAGIWGLPNETQVVGTIAAVTTFLGVILGISSATYHKSSERFDGTIDVYDDGDTKKFMLNLDSDPYLLEDKSEVVFKVNDLGEL